MDEQLRREINEDNRKEALRAKGLAARDWSVVLLATIVFAALLGFIYYADETGVDEAAVEPASGSSFMSYETNETPAPATTNPERPVE